MKATRIIHVTDKNSRHWYFFGAYYTRVGDLAVFNIGRLGLYCRIGSRWSIRPHIIPKGA